MFFYKSSKGCFSCTKSRLFVQEKTWKPTVQQNRRPEVFVLFVLFVVSKRIASE